MWNRSESRDVAKEKKFQADLLTTEFEDLVVELARHGETVRKITANVRTYLSDFLVDEATVEAKLAEVRNEDPEKPRHRLHNRLKTEFQKAAGRGCEWMLVGYVRGAPLPPICGEVRAAGKDYCEYHRVRSSKDPEKAAAADEEKVAASRKKPTRATTQVVSKAATRTSFMDRWDA
jgi:hypothetical protein